MMEASVKITFPASVISNRESILFMTVRTAVVKFPSMILVVAWSKFATTPGPAA